MCAGTNHVEKMFASQMPASDNKHDMSLTAISESVVSRCIAVINLAIITSTINKLLFIPIISYQRLHFTGVLLKINLDFFV